MQRLERREEEQGARVPYGALNSSTSASANLLFRPKGFTAPGPNESESDPV